MHFRSHRKFLVFAVFIPIIGLSGFGSSPSHRSKSPVSVSHLSSQLPNNSKTSGNAHTFSNDKYWIDPNANSYPKGISTVKTPNVPSAFEQSVIPSHGIANLMVSAGSGKITEIGTKWEREIQFETDQLKINGKIYTVPKQFANRKMFVLPIAKGIVWAPVTEMPPTPRGILKSLKGVTEIFYTPYQSNGGSLAENVQKIGAIPHGWMGEDGPSVTTTWTGWISPHDVSMPHIESIRTYHLTYDSNGKLKSHVPVNQSKSSLSTLYMKSMPKMSYYKSPHYAAFIQSMTRTYGGFVLSVSLIDATQTGRNAGLDNASYYWSEKTQKWSPLTQMYVVQTLGGLIQTGSDSVYWIQPSGGYSSGNQMDVTQMYFNPATLTTRSIWLGNWFGVPGIVDANSWITALPVSIDKPPVTKPKSWTVYTP